MPLADQPAGKAVAGLRVIVCGLAGEGLEVVVNLLGLHTLLEPVYDSGFVAEVAALSDALEDDAHAGSRAEQIAAATLAWKEELIDSLRHPPRRRLPFGDSHITFLLDLEPALERLRQAANSASGLKIAARELVEELFARQLDWGNKRCWISSSRAYLPALAALRRMFPEALFVLVLRDPRAILAETGLSGERLALAARKLAAEAAEVLPDEIARAVDGEDPRAAGEPPAERSILVRYEQLLEDPAAELSRVCVALGIAPEGEKMVAIFENVVPLAVAAPAPEPLDAADAELIEAELAGVLPALGYELTATGAVAGDPHPQERA